MGERARERERERERGRERETHFAKEEADRQAQLLHPRPCLENAPFRCLCRFLFVFLHLRSLSDFLLLLNVPFWFLHRLRLSLAPRCSEECKIFVLRFVLEDRQRARAALSRGPCLPEVVASVEADVLTC